VNVETLEALNNEVKQMRKGQLLLHFQKWLTKLASTKFHDHHQKKRWLKRGLNVIKFHPILLTYTQKKRVKIWKWSLGFLVNLWLLCFQHF